ncbi:MAG: hypothetical protein HDR88_02640 [Bacteroides sp.]|nr:hypothetical protein [Bacteroides sp.]
MKLKYNIIAVAMGLLMIGGCSDSDDWAPGPQDENTGVSAYFDNPSARSFIFDSSSNPEDMRIDVSVSRQNTEGEASVGVILSSEVEGFSCPSSVSFAAGEATSTISIDCSGIPAGTRCSLTLSLNADQTNIYGIGLYELTLSAIKADWVLLSDKARYLYSDWSSNELFPTTYGELYQLEGTMMFKLTDFFGSGLDITYECNEPQNAVLYPLQNADFENVYDDDKDYMGWYLYDEANMDWPVWVPGDAEGYNAIASLLLYSDSYYNVCSMVYDETTLYGYIGLTTGVTYDTGSFVWGNFQIDFNLAYNPFE